ncbi:MAG: hypothetical protein KDE46_01200 [Caldilineaceae bacterium]|nr:hypothetical protein [Caldilineaceae bacterium]
MYSIKKAPGDQTRGGFSTVSGGADSSNYTTQDTPTATQNADKTTFTGIDAMRKLARAGGSFVLLTSEKGPIEKEWNSPGHEIPFTRAAAYIAKPKRSAGLLCGKRFVVFDIDRNYHAQRAALGESGQTWEITRPERPDRGALVYLVDDQAQPSVKWRPDGKTPYVEFLSHARNGNYSQKVIAGEAGNYQLHTQHPLKTVTPSEIAGIYFILTGEDIDAPIQRVERFEKRSDVDRSETSIIARIKQVCTPYAVFKRFGYNGMGEQKEKPYIRFFKHAPGMGLNGGLLVGDPDGPKREHWHWFGMETGGDCIDAWQICTGQPFNDALREMCEIYGIAYREPAKTVVDGQEYLIYDLMNAAYVIAGNIDIGKRSSEYQRDILRGIIKIARQQDSLSPVATQRYLCEMAGIKRRETLKRWRLELFNVYVTIQEKEFEKEKDTYSFTETWLLEIARYAQFIAQNTPQRAAGLGPFGLQTVHISAFGGVQMAQRDIFQRSGPGPKFKRSVSNVKPDEGFIESGATREARLSGLSELMNALVEDDSDKGLKPLCKHGKRFFELLDTEGMLSICRAADEIGVHRNTITAIVRRATTDIERFAKVHDIPELRPLLEVRRVGREKCVSLPDDIKDRMKIVERYLVNDGQFKAAQMRHISQRIKYCNGVLEFAQTEEAREEYTQALAAAHEWRDRLVNGDGRKGDIDASTVATEAPEQPVIVATVEQPVERLETPQQPTEPVTEPQTTVPALAFVVKDQQRINSAVMGAFTSDYPATRAAAQRVYNIIMGTVPAPEPATLQGYLNVLDAGLHYSIDWAKYRQVAA